MHSQSSCLGQVEPGTSPHSLTSILEHLARADDPLVSAWGRELLTRGERSAPAIRGTATLDTATSAPGEQLAPSPRAITSATARQRRSRSAARAGGKGVGHGSR